MLKISNLQVRVNNEIIIDGLNISIGKGETHALMGPNGAGKSTIAQVIAGNSNYNITKGTIDLVGEDIMSLSADERAKKGIFMSFQYPVEIPGVSWLNFLKASVNSIRTVEGLEGVNASEFFRVIEEKAEALSIPKGFLKRSVNDGFSGGEKKKLEVLQMLLLAPKFIILDELDSGLDIDAFKQVVKSINEYRDFKETTVLIITHHQKILQHIKPDFIHVLHKGNIISSGDFSLAEKIEKDGYEQFISR
jgi:Fe-S cluster assembly ATP-binding protein